MKLVWVVVFYDHTYCTLFALLLCSHLLCLHLQLQFAIYCNHTVHMFSKLSQTILEKIEIKLIIKYHYF